MSVGTSGEGREPLGGYVTIEVFTWVGVHPEMSSFTDKDRFRFHEL